MASVIVADPSGLLGLLSRAKPGGAKSLFDQVTSHLTAGTLRFSREVVEELHIVARNDFLSGWAAGLGDKKDKWTSEAVYMRQVMRLAVDLGFEDGFVSLDNRDPAIAFVARMCFELEDQGIKFCVLSEDTGSNPLSPTMEELCAEAGWEFINPDECVARLKLRL